MVKIHDKLKSTDDLKMFMKTVETAEPRLVYMTTDQITEYLDEYEICVWKPVSPYPGLKAIYSEQINTYVVNHLDYDKNKLLLWFSKHKFDIIVLKSPE